MVSMAATDASGGTPTTRAAASAIAALAALQRPGSCRRRGKTSPPVRVMRPGSATTSGAGRANPHRQNQTSPSQEIRPPHSGQLAESIRHGWPAETHVTAGAAPAAQATSGSSA